MEYTFVYADLRTQVTINADGKSVIGQITDKELNLLRSVIYLSLMTYVCSKISGGQECIGQDIIEGSENVEGNDDG